AGLDCGSHDGAHEVAHAASAGRHLLDQHGELSSAHCVHDSAASARRTHYCIVVEEAKAKGLVGNGMGPAGILRRDVMTESAVGPIGVFTVFLGVNYKRCAS